MAVGSAPKIFYAAAVEAMFLRGVGRELSAAAHGRLRAAGLDVTRPIPATVPAEQLRRWMDILREDLYPGMPVPRADELLGRRFVTGFAQTLVGKATVQILRLLGPARTIRRVDEQMRQLNNFTRARLELTTPERADYHLNEPAISAAYARGSVHQLLIELGLTHSRVEEVACEPPAVHLQLTWDVRGAPARPY